MIGGDSPTGADLQIAPLARIPLTIGDLRPTPRLRVAQRFFADYPGDVPAGALPEGWLPA